MCTDPNHMKEFKDIAESMARMETKLDNVLSIVNDHEARIRVAETAIIIHNDNKQEYDNMKTQLATLSTMVTASSNTIAGWSKALWIIGTASFAGLGLGIWDLIKRGVSGG